MIPSDQHRDMRWPSQDLSLRMQKLDLRRQLVLEVAQHLLLRGQLSSLLARASFRE